MSARCLYIAGWLFQFVLRHDLDELREQVLLYAIINQYSCVFRTSIAVSSRGRRCPRGEVMPTCSLPAVLGDMFVTLSVVGYLGVAESRVGPGNATVLLP